MNEDDGSFLAYNLLIQPPEEDNTAVPTTINTKPKKASRRPPKKNYENGPSSLNIVGPSSTDTIPHQKSENTRVASHDTTHNGFEVRRSDVHHKPPTSSIRNISQEVYSLQKNRMEDAFSEMQHEFPKDRSRPLIVLDCANIGWAYGIDSFSPTGVLLAIQYFQSIDAEMKAFLPAHYIRSKPRDGSSSNAMMLTDDIEILQNLAGTRHLTIVPAGDYDDAYILNYARENCGFVVSNDLFQDHIRKQCNESIRLSMKLWIADNRCGYAFVGTTFVLNPCSNLNLSLKRMIYHELSMGKKVFLPATLGQIDHELATTATQLGKLCTHLLSLNRANEMKHTILARAYLLIELGCIDECVLELKFILESIDSNCVEAITLLQEISQVYANRNER